MKLIDFVLLFAVCFVWGLNIVVTRWVVSDLGVPPLAYASLRFLVLIAVLLPFLLPRPLDLARLFFIAMGVGAAHFGLLFAGLAISDASSVAVVSQLGVPFSTILSVLFLGEKIRWRRTLGIFLSFLGVLVIAWKPGGLIFSSGLLLVVGAALVGAIAAILMKRIDPMPAIRMQAWVALFSAPPLILCSMLIEQGQVAAIATGGWGLVGATAFAALVVSVFGHGGFYFLLKRYEVTQISPLTLMTPIWGVLLGIVILGEPFGARQILGSLIVLAGVGIIAVRPNMTSPLAGLGRKLFQ